MCAGVVAVGYFAPVISNGDVDRAKGLFFSFFVALYFLTLSMKSFLALVNGGFFLHLTFSYFAFIPISVFIMYVILSRKFQERIDAFLYDPTSYLPILIVPVFMAVIQKLELKYA